MCLMVGGISRSGAHASLLCFVPAADYIALVPAVEHKISSLQHLCQLVTSSSHSLSPARNLFVPLTDYLKLTLPRLDIMDVDKTQSTQIIWPSSLQAGRDMTYESIDLLYRASSQDAFGDQLGFILSCSRSSMFETDDKKGMLHKLEVSAMPDFARSQMEITHEVLPGLGAAGQVVPVNADLKVAGFDSGCIIPIKNFGYKKTFNSDVRGRLSHHSGQVCCLASNNAGTKLASGCTAGEITLYHVGREDIKFQARLSDTDSSIISAMSFIKTDDFNSEENVLMYANDLGQVFVFDTRCEFATPPPVKLLFETKPRLSVTTMACPRSRSDHLFYLGGPQGELLAFDFRRTDKCVNNIQPNDSCNTIKRMKEVVVQDGDGQKTFLAYSNSTNKIKILDLDTLKFSDNWKCDRLPEGSVRDLIQVGDRIVTCGANVSIGCWYWDRQTTADR